jgi:hypothetical protein
MPASSREQQCERGALAFARLDPYFPAVRLRDVPYDRQAKACAPGRTAAGSVDAIEALEDPLEIA